jgi:AmmeMemoRadiSam system protein B/AmmeMemoRadiSam system protein A
MSLLCSSAFRTLATMTVWIVFANCCSAQSDVRAPAVAAQFYPGEPARLKLAIQQFLKDAPKLRLDRPLAIVVPHAGYIFAGQIYADAYRQVMEREYDLVVILGTNHTSGDFRGISVYPRGSFQTPLGRAAVDEGVAAALLAEDKDCAANVEVHAREHSVEVQIPFIQVVFPRAKIVPVVVGTDDDRTCTRFGEALAKVVRNRRVLIVISSDLSHYPSYEDAQRTDRRTLDAILKFSVKEFRARLEEPFGNTRNLVTYACGEAPILAGLAAARALGATGATLVSYANSGDLAVGDRSRVVGYGAVVLGSGTGSPVPDLRSVGKTSSAGVALQASEKTALLKLARETIKRYLTTETVPLPRGYPARLQAPEGAFVTLKKRGELRGCIGHIPPDFQLCQTVADMAAQAAFNDRRFQPVDLSELDDLEIEISVLTPMEPISSAGQIRVGRDGVVLFKNGRSAVFLPQVAVEQKWGRDELLDNLCLKAGLSVGCWRNDAKLQVFQADVFSESEYR